MAEMYGADADTLDVLSSEFKQAAEDLANQADQLTRTLQNVSWLGDVATNFQDLWSSESKPKMQMSATFLQEAASTLTRQAAEQRQASAANGSPGGTYGPNLPGTTGGPPGRTYGPEVPGPTVGPWVPGPGDGDNGSGWSFLNGSFDPSYRLELNNENDEMDFGVQLVDGSLVQYNFLGDAGKVELGKAEAGIGINFDGADTTIGAFGEVTVLHAEVGGTVLGDENLGLTTGASVDVLKAEADLGYKDGSFDFSAEAKLVDVDGEVGVNVDGHNLSVDGSIGIKFGLGGSIGKHTKLKLGPLTVGFNFDW